MISVFAKRNRVLLGLVACLILGGCSQQTSPYPHDDFYPAEESLPSTSVPETSEGLPDEAEFAEAEPALTLQSEDIEYPSSFSNGVAWVSYFDGEQLLVDETGKVLFEEEDSRRGFSDFAGGSAVVFDATEDDDYGPYGLINKQGDIFWTIDGDARAKAEELYGAENIERIYCPELNGNSKWGGYLVVSVEVDCYEFTGSVCGIVGPDGTWAVELPTIDEAAGGSRIFDYVAGSLYDLYQPELLILHKCGLFLYRTGEFVPCAEEGVGWGGMYYLYGEEKISEKDALARERALARGGLFFSCGIFYDEDRNEVLDLTELKDVDTHPEYEFEDGEHCLINFQNDGGGRYQTIIDREGNFLFDPIKVGNEAEFASVGFFYQPDENEKGWYVGVGGEHIGEVEGTEGMPFFDGRAWIKVDGVWRILNESGEIVV